MRSLSMHHDPVRATGLSLSLTAMAARMMATIAMWNARSRERRFLAHLDDRMLADVGLSRSQIRHEMGKGFWER